MRRGLSRTHGVILLGTPHFLGGLAEWAYLSARSIGIPTARNPRRQDWSSVNEDDPKNIAKMQKVFRDMAKCKGKGYSLHTINTTCCWAALPVQRFKFVSISLPLIEHGFAEFGLTFPQIMSPEWVLLPAVDLSPIGTDHFGMMNFDEINRFLPEWFKDYPISQKGWPESQSNESNVQSYSGPEDVQRSIAFSKDGGDDMLLEAIETP